MREREGREMAEGGAELTGGLTEQSDNPAVELPTEGPADKPQGFRAVVQTVCVRARVYVRVSRFSLAQPFFIPDC